MMRFRLILAFVFTLAGLCSGQVVNTQTQGILFHGVVWDASNLTPLSNAQIAVNRIFSAVSDLKGNFSFYAEKNDTVVFKSLGFKSFVFYVCDTLTGNDFITGVFMHTDTLAIGEVVIMPRLANLKSSILKSPVESKPEVENARYNLAISAYQGRQSQTKIGDPQSNYEILRNRQRIEAYEKGGIPSDRIAGFSPFLDRKSVV